MVVDHVLVVDRDIDLSRGDGLVTEDLGQDVHRQSSGRRVGGEDAPKVVRGEPQRPAVGGGDAGGAGPADDADQEIAA